MIRNSSQEKPLRLNPRERSACKACGLYLNQLPLLDKTKKGQVFWVGLSAVQMEEDQPPLSYDTRSGSLVAEVENPFVKELSFYRTNVVKCLPLNLDDKIRYPLKGEMEKCFPNLEEEIDFLQPSIIFLLGRQAADFVMRKYGFGSWSLNAEFNYEAYHSSGMTFIPVHHPSYILVYKRKRLIDYVQGIQKHLTQLVAKPISLSEHVEQP